MHPLRQFTNARVGLERVGDAVTTESLLEFRMAHAKARDAVDLELDKHSIATELAMLDCESILLTTQARNRKEFILRPDLGRKLSDKSTQMLETAALQIPVVYCLADGLSAAALHRHAVNLLRELKPSSPVMIIEQARVAIGDSVGFLVQAELCVLLIGERPGLSSPDSLSVYITYRPHPGCSDSQRNCISNIHDNGLSYALAARRTEYLIQQARQLKLTGVALKERAGLLSS